MVVLYGGDVLCVCVCVHVSGVPTCVAFILHVCTVVLCTFVCCAFVLWA